MVQTFLMYIGFCPIFVLHDDLLFIWKVMSWNEMEKISTRSSGRSKEFTEGKLFPRILTVGWNRSSAPFFCTLHLLRPALGLTKWFSFLLIHFQFPCILYVARFLLLSFFSTFLTSIWILVIELRNTRSECFVRIPMSATPPFIKSFVSYLSRILSRRTKVGVLISSNVKKSDLLNEKKYCFDT